MSRSGADKKTKLRRKDRLDVSQVASALGLLHKTSFESFPCRDRLCVNRWTQLFSLPCGIVYGAGNEVCTGAVRERPVRDVANPPSP